LIYAYHHNPIIQARKMANPEHLALLKQGVEAWNKWRQANPGIEEPDLREAYLRKMDLYKADLHGANLSGANLSGDLYVNLRRADLSGANLSRADLSGANLSMVNLCKVDLREAYLMEAHLCMVDLSKADLTKADLTRADLVRVNLCGADLRWVELAETVFSDVNLAEAKNLDACRHIDPSVLDFRTLQQSGPLPLVFLRGCGLPDLLIDYLPSLRNQSIQRYSCALSVIPVKTKTSLNARMPIYKIRGCAAGLR
jgi:hypothetical protein